MTLPSAPFARCLQVDPYYLSVIETLELPQRFRDGLTPEVARHYQHALERFRAGDRPAARTLLDGLATVLAGADRGLCRAMLAMVLSVDGDHDAAEAELARAMAVAPDCPEYRHLAGVLAVRRRDPAAAAARFAEAARLAPGFGPPRAALALLLALDGQWAEVAEPAKGALAAGCELGASLVGYSLWFSTLFQGGPDPGGFLLPAPRTVTAAAVARVLAGLPAVEMGATAPSSGDRPMVFVFCDTGYLEPHALPLVWSLEDVGAGCAVHLHVANPAPGDAARLEAVAARLRQVHLGWSFETVDLDRFGPASVYYSCARFCRFYQLVRDRRRPVLMVDADSLFQRPPESLPGWGCPGIDVGLVDNPMAPPWERFIAWGTYVAPTPAGLDFLGRVAFFVGRNLLARTGRWFLDQTALFLAHQSRPTGLGLALWHAANGPFDLGHRDDAVVWTVALDKTGEGPYNRRKDALRCRFDGSAT